MIIDNVTRRGFLKSSALGVSGTVGALATASREASAEDASSTPSQQKTYTLTRRIPAEGGYDLIVCGGGPAGTAAVCAARLGAKVLLVEAGGCLGGMGTCFG